jgi:hypothetical protein
MGGWFSKWSSPMPKAKAKANIVGCSKPITDPNIIRQFEDHIYGIEMIPRPKREVIHQPVKIMNNSVI